MMKHVTITFDLENEIDAKIYYVVENLSKYYERFCGVGQSYTIRGAHNVSQRFG